MVGVERSGVTFGLAPEVVGAVLIRVLDAGSQEGAEVLICQAVKDRSAFTARLNQGSVSMQT